MNEQPATRRASAAACIGALVMCAATAWGQAPQQPAALAGQWRLAGIELKGQSVPESDLPIVTLRIDADGRWSDSDGGKATYTVDNTKSPRWIDIVHTDGTGAGSKQTGVYELTESTLRLALSALRESANSRPTSFDSKTGPEVVLTFQRQK